MSLLSIEVLCEKCNERYGILVERDKRNDPQLCELCEGGHAHRVMSVPNVSTEKTSETIPDVTAQGRFDHLRAQQEIRKELATAKKDYVKNPTKENHEQVKRLRKEKKKTEGK
jgi:hypothetical protein